MGGVRREEWIWIRWNMGYVMESMSCAIALLRTGYRGMQVVHSTLGPEPNDRSQHKIHVREQTPTPKSEGGWRLWTPPARDEDHL